MKRSLSFFEIAWAWSKKRENMSLGRGLDWDCLFQCMTIFVRINLTSCDHCSHTTTHCFLESVLVKSFSCCWKISVRSPGKFGITQKSTVKSRSLPPLRAGFVGQLACLHQMHQGDQGNNSSHLKNMFPGLEDSKGWVMMMMMMMVVVMMMMMMMLMMMMMMLIDDWWLMIDEDDDGDCDKD